MATLPRVWLRNMTAMRRAKGSCARDSWIRPKRGEERGGKGMQDVAGRLGRGCRGVLGGVGK